jgi:azurin
MRHVSVLLLAAVVAAAPALVIAEQATAKPKGRVVDIEATDKMQFSVTTINAKPGEALHIRLKAVSTLPKAAMAHNFVLFKSSATQKQIADFATAGMSKGPVTYIPDDMKSLVLASTAMAGGGQTVEVAFTAPKEPGTYPYICSFTGHYLVGMKGNLIVK